MAKKVQPSLEDQLRDFESAPPKNLGNFPDELDRPLPTQHLETPEPDPEPELAPEPDTVAVGDEESPEERRVRELEERISAQSREMDFLRAGYQQGAAAQPAAQPQPQDAIAMIDRYLGGSVSPEDWQTMLQDPEKGAAWAQNALRAAVAAGAAIATNQLRAEYQQVQQAAQQGTSLRDQFYSQNPDLQDWPEVVLTEAQRVKAKYPLMQSDALIRETAVATRQTLAARGVKLGPRAAARSTRRGPAYADMGGGGGGGGGGRKLSAVEKQLREFESATNTYHRG